MTAAKDAAMLTLDRPLNPPASRLPVERAGERRRHFEAMYLRSHVEMRARRQPA